MLSLSVQASVCVRHRQYPVISLKVQTSYGVCWSWTVDLAFFMWILVVLLMIIKWYEMIQCKKPTHQLEVMPDHIRVMFISWDFYGQTTILLHDTLWIYYPLESANMIILWSFHKTLYGSRILQIVVI